VSDTDTLPAHRWWELDPCPSWCSGHREPAGPDEVTPVADRIHMSEEQAEVHHKAEDMHCLIEGGKHGWTSPKTIAYIEQQYREREPRVVLVTDDTHADPRTGNRKYHGDLDRHFTLDEAATFARAVLRLVETADGVKPTDEPSLGGAYWTGYRDGQASVAGGAS
jgi:hypothetical protein